MWSATRVDSSVDSFIVKCPKSARFCDKLGFTESRNSDTKYQSPLYISTLPMTQPLPCFSEEIAPCLAFSRHCMPSFWTKGIHRFSAPARSLSWILTSAGLLRAARVRRTALPRSEEGKTARVRWLRTVYDGRMQLTVPAGGHPTAILVNDVRAMRLHAAVSFHAVCEREKRVVEGSSQSEDVVVQARSEMCHAGPIKCVEF